MEVMEKELRKKKWTKKEYQKYLKYLKEIKEEEYAKFSKKIISTKYEMLGIRIPMQRKIAKEIQKGDVTSFLSFCGKTYYEEVLIEGLVIAGLKEKEEFDQYFEPFLLKIDNWAICDSVCSGAKIISKYPSFYFEKINEWLQSDETFTVRVGLVLLLNYYMTEEYVPKILELVSNIHREEYYINMAIAWLVAEITIRFPSIGLPFLKEKKLDSFVQNKTISKIKDSYRVSKSDKEKLNSYKK